MSSGSSQVAESWISGFCSIVGHEYFAEVSEDFIEDDFNLTGLSNQVPMYKEALELILDVEPEDDDDEDEEEEDDDDDDIDLLEDRPAGYTRQRRNGRLSSDIVAIEASAELLYGLIHQRYITSRPGIGQMHEKYELGHFGACPRVYCSGAKVLPVGNSDTPGQATVKLFCPSCLDVYTPPNSRFQTVDGAFFGTTFGCLFLMTFPDLQVAGSNSTVRSPGVLSPSPSVSALTDDATPSANSLAIAAGAGTPTAAHTPSRARFLSPASSPSLRTPAQPAEINGVAFSNFAPGLGLSQIYEPRIYGFRVSERARTGPRMKWLRMKPDDVTELDEARRLESMSAEEMESEGLQGAGHDDYSNALELKDARTVRGADDEPYIDGEGIDAEEHLPDRSHEAVGDAVAAAMMEERLKQRKKAPMRARRRTSGSNEDGVGGGGGGPGGPGSTGGVLGPGGIGAVDVNGVGVG